MITEIFSLTIQPPATDVPFEGPIPLSLVVKYHGKQPIEILSDDFIKVEFEAPPGWKLKEKSKIQQLDGRLPTLELSEGQSFSRQIYLHDYFSSITTGATRLAVAVGIGSTSQNARDTFTLRQECTFNVMEPDPEQFADRLRQIHDQVLAEQSAENRIELYRSLASLSHPYLIRVFLESLLDPYMLVFHVTARRRLVDLVESYGQRELLIKHLANNGGRYDAEFFRLWNEKQIRLSEEEIARLCESSSPWTRLFCLEQYQGQYNRKGLIESLKAELGELAQRVHDLEKIE